MNISEVSSNWPNIRELSSEWLNLREFSNDWPNIRELFADWLSVRELYADWLNIFRFDMEGAALYSVKWYRNEQAGGGPILNIFSDIYAHSLHIFYIFPLIIPPLSPPPIVFLQGPICAT